MAVVVDLEEMMSSCGLGIWIWCCVKAFSVGGTGERWVLQKAECIIFATLWGPYLSRYQHQFME